MSAAPPVSVGLVGCGAVSELYYGPALATLEREDLVRLVGVHDPDARAAGALTASFPAARRHATFEELLAQAPALVIIASPPRHHADQTIAALDAGLDVHCEKPLALGAAEARTMLAAATTAGRRLSVGMVRRHFPATRMIRRLLTSGSLGELRAIECFEGGPFDWPIRSVDHVRAGARGSGVLHDIGTHCLDLLTWWLGDAALVSYEDDAMGGVEANCRIELDVGGARAHVRLSRDWARPNRYLITGTAASIAWQVNESDHFELHVPGAPDAAEVMVARAPDDARRQGPGAPADDFMGCFTNQIRALVDPARADDAVLAADALAVVDLIERCSLARRPMPMPWLAPVREGAP